jgi:hypothetical protein
MNDPFSKHITVSTVTDGHLLDIMFGVPHDVLVFLQLTLALHLALCCCICPSKPTLLQHLGLLVGSQH